MLRIAIWIIYVFVCAGAVATYVNQPQSLLPPVISDNPLWAFIGIMLLTQIVPLIDLLIPKKRIEAISAVYFGLLIGIWLSYLLMLAVQPVIPDPNVRPIVVLMSNLIFPFICISLLLQTKDDFRFIIPYVEFARELKGARPLIMDSSALIDGRIVDLVETNIISSRILIPKFILLEVQDIADSSDKMRRSRGRRGLEMLSKLQSTNSTEVQMYEGNEAKYRGVSVDQKLVELAKDIGGTVVTNDFNLNKVASVQGIPVINLNDVANAVKPRYIPGERLKIKIIKEGETPGQGVGYLDDGTMVVCEQANHLLNKDVDVIVTSVLQSSAGRMIFGKLVYTPQRNSERASSSSQKSNPSTTSSS